MSQIIIDHNPSAEKLKELGVSSWSIWDCEPSKFPLDFSMTESAYVLEGEFHVTPQGGDKVVIKAGDFVVFPKGLKSQWEVVKTLKKHYKHS
ncbi:MAG TPA: cupin [Methylophilaceae bacterium]|nr:cupin [Methylophilaceae bacterium]HAJ72214.1 cupin [Methylophilaceae bacterium]